MRTEVKDSTGWEWLVAHLNDAVPLIKETRDKAVPFVDELIAKIDSSAEQLTAQSVFKSLEYLEVPGCSGGGKEHGGLLSALDDELTDITGSDVAGQFEQEGFTESEEGYPWDDKMLYYADFSGTIQR